MSEFSDIECRIPHSSDSTLPNRQAHHPRPDIPPPNPTALTSVVVTGLEDDQIITINEIDEAMLVGDAPRPCSGRTVCELLRFPDAGKGLTQACIKNAY